MTGDKKRKNRKKKNHKKHKTSKNDELTHETNEQLNSGTKKHLDDEDHKRHHDPIDDDSDTEVVPRKKKKKKPSVPEEGESKKGKKSIRAMKREKFAQRQADTAAAAKDHLKSQCLSYMSQWKHDKQNWKFMKAKQVWLYKNKFNSNLVPNSSWALLLEYFESCQGNIRNMLLEDSNKVIKQMDEWTEKNPSAKADDNLEEDDEDEGKPDETSYKRARDLIQCLQD